MFIVAGEPSGDRLGAELLKAIRINAAVSPIGIGGPELAGEGLRSLFPMSNLSVMGIRDVIVRLPLLYWRVRQTVRAIRGAKADLVLFIDSQVFSEAVARELRKGGYRGKILLYVAPSVWAWKPERALALRPLYDEVFGILPFEPAVMKELGGPRTTYVGHPALAQTFRQAQPSVGPLLLLPGSRSGELRRHLPLMRKVAKAVIDDPSITELLLPTVRSQARRVEAEVARWNLPIRVVVSGEDKHRAFSAAVAAVAVSGTVTLELALAGVPMVTTYVADSGQMRRAKRYAVRHAALPNILFGDDLVPEIVGGEPQPTAVSDALLELLHDSAAIARQLTGFASIRAEMQSGRPGAPRVDPATLLVDYFRLLRGT